VARPADRAAHAQLEQRLKMARSGHRSSNLAEDPAALTEQIEQLSKLSAKAMKDRWRSLFGDHPIPHIGRSLMIMAMAYRLQEKAYGGLKPSAERMLARIIDEHSYGQRLTATRPLVTGTVLVREWRGARHRVTVDEQGVVYRDRCYRSLSEVARAITGTRWSGPRFFGLGRRTKESANGWSSGQAMRCIHSQVL
jgi:hypothetical protein